MLDEGSVTDLSPASHAGETAAASPDLRVDALARDHVTVSLAAGADADRALAGGLAIATLGQLAAILMPASFERLPPDEGGRMRLRARLPFDPGEAATRSTVDVQHAVTGAGLPNGHRKPLPRTRKARALVLIPAGARYDHDKIRIHAWPMERIVGTYVNVGDLMVYDSTLKVLDFETVEVGNITAFTDKDVDRYNAEFDFVFLRGSNFIHEYMDWQRTGELLARLRLPVFAIGVGAQAESRRSIVLPAEARRVWAEIADHCGTIGVRGAYSAEVLAANGVTNVEVVGCPSIFRTRDPNLRLRLKPVHDVRRVAFSLRRETSPNYARDMGRFSDVQKTFMLRLDEEAAMTVTCHGEPEEKAYFFKDKGRIPAARESLKASGWFDPDNEPALEDIYRHRLFFNTSVEEYDTFVRGQDLAIGYRVHGILPGLANGTPGLLVDYDERSAELAHTHRIPTVAEAELADGASWRQLYAPERFKPFQDEYPKGYARMVRFLDHNGVPHRL
jgi:hypothetical protein